MNNYQKVCSPHFSAPASNPKGERSSSTTVPPIRRLVIVPLRLQPAELRWFLFGKQPAMCYPTSNGRESFRQGYFRSIGWRVYDYPKGRGSTLLFDPQPPSAVIDWLGSRS